MPPPLRNALVAGILAAAFLALPVSSARPIGDGLDERAATVAHQIVVQAAVAFAAAKAINAGVSLAKSATVGAGVGIQASLSPGAVLDPIDKLVEELSDLLLLVATAAGAFELLVRIAAGIDPVAVLALALVIGGVGLACRFVGRPPVSPRFGGGCLAGVGVLLFARFGVAVALVASAGVADLALAGPYQRAAIELSTIAGRAQAAADAAGNDSEQGRGRIASWLGSASAGVAGVGAALALIHERYDSLFIAAVTIGAVFALEAVILPLGCLCLLWGACRWAALAGRLL